jgi:hypothetical protein
LNPPRRAADAGFQTQGPAVVGRAGVAVGGSARTSQDTPVHRHGGRGGIVVGCTARTSAPCPAPALGARVYTRPNRRYRHVGRAGVVVGGSARVGFRDAIEVEEVLALIASDWAARPSGGLDLAVLRILLEEDDADVAGSARRTLIQLHEQRDRPDGGVHSFPVGGHRAAPGDGHAGARGAFVRGSFPSGRHGMRYSRRGRSRTTGSTPTRMIPASGRGAKVSKPLGATKLFLLMFDAAVLRTLLKRTQLTPDGHVPEIGELAGLLERLTGGKSTTI